MDERVRIAFVCTGNSCRSRMAEAFAARALGDAADVVSANSFDQHAAVIFKGVHQRFQDLRVRFLILSAVAHALQALAG